MSDDPVAKTPGWIWKALFVVVGFGLLWAVFAGVEITEVWRNASAVGWGMIGVLGLYLVTFAIDSVSWLLALVSAPTNLRWAWRAFAVRMVGETYNNIIPAASMGGEPIKAMLLKRHYAVRYRDSTASLILAKTINMVGLCLFLIIGFVLMIETDKLSSAYKHTAGVGLAVMLISTVLFFSIQRLRIGSVAGGWLGRRTVSEQTSRIVNQIRHMDETLVRFYTVHRARLFGALALAFINWMLGIVEIYYVLWLLDAPISWSEAWIIEAVVQMVRSGTFFIPLSIGAQEGVFLIVAGVITGLPAVGLSVGLVRRFRELLWIAWGYLIGVWYTARYRHLEPSGDIN